MNTTKIDTGRWRQAAARLAPGILLALIAVSGGACSTTAPVAKDVPCEGPACGDVRIWYDGCYQAANHGNQQVIVTMSPWARVVPPGEQITLKSDVKDAPCPKAFYGKVKASY